MFYKDAVQEPQLDKDNKWVVKYKDLGFEHKKKFNTKEEALVFYKEKIDFFKSWFEQAIEYFRDHER